LQRWRLAHRTHELRLPSPAPYVASDNERGLDSSVLEHPGQRFEFVLQHAVLLL
jgi:hypothetical protein